MSKIELITKRNCEACSIMLHNIADVLDEVTNEITFRVIHIESLSVDEIESIGVSKFPTVIIKEHEKEVARIEGTYSKEYLMDVINKIK